MKIRFLKVKFKFSCFFKKIELNSKVTKIRWITVQVNSVFGGPKAEEIHASSNEISQFGVTVNEKKMTDFEQNQVLKFSQGKSVVSFFESASWHVHFWYPFKVLNSNFDNCFSTFSCNVPWKTWVPLRISTLQKFKKMPLVWCHRFSNCCAW